MPTANEDIIDALLADHQQIKLLFAQVETATGEYKQQLFADLVRLLAVHESVEEQLVHPLARRKLNDGDAIIGPRLAEEDDAKAALADLYDLGTDHPDFNSRLVALRDAVSAHAEAEEELEFGQLREVVKEDQLERMRQVMTVAAGLASTRPHPDVPSNPAANLLVGTPMAVFDRVRDAVHNATAEVTS
jgi:hemerythrin superfamily protein